MNELVWLPVEPGSKHGQVCVKYTYTHHSEPKLIIVYWPASEVLYGPDVFIILPEIDNGGHPEVRNGGSGSYDLYRGYGNHVPIWLLQAGQTKAIKFEEEAIQPPKVRKGTETRWYNSAWQKYSKREGWIFA